MSLWRIEKKKSLTFQLAPSYPTIRQNIQRAATGLDPSSIKHILQILGSSRVNGNINALSYQEVVTLGRYGMVTLVYALRGAGNSNSGNSRMRMFRG